VHLPHSYDETLFSSKETTASRIKSSASDGQKVILYPVNVYPRKNIELAIDVLGELARFCDCKLIVTGKIWDQTYLSNLLQRASERSVADRIQFLGGVPIEMLVQLFHQADVTVYTSHQETFGHGLVESLGCGTPVVGPDWIIPCREILSSAAGGRVAPKDPQQFAAAILETLHVGSAPEEIAASTKACYGNMTVGARFLEKCHQIKAEKDRYASQLKTIHWKGLYQDAGDLL
jgi:glycosyltransferase involved in cell wall biosynthesis